MIKFEEACYSCLGTGEGSVYLLGTKTSICGTCAGKGRVPLTATWTWPQAKIANYHYWRVDWVQWQAKYGN